MAKVLFISTSNESYERLPITPSLFISLLRNAGNEVRLFDTALYPEFTEAVDSTSFAAKREKAGTVRSFDDSFLKLLVNNDNKKSAQVDIENCINSFSPNLIMISLNEAMYEQTMQILNYIIPYNIITVLGGVFPTFAPEFLLRHKGVDIVCVGEGEMAAVELCNRLDKNIEYNNISNLHVKCKNGDIIKNPSTWLADLNTLPTPDFSLFENVRFYSPMAGKLWKMLPFETNRGCAGKCVFCNSPAQKRLYKNVDKNHFRKKTVEKIYNELNDLTKKYSPELIYFCSDTFMTFKECELSEFVEMYKSIKLPFYMMTRVETVTEENIKKLRDVGLFRMSIGIEHGNEDFRQKVLKKSVSNEEIIKAIKIIHGNNLPGGLTLLNMVGFPSETRDLAMDTVRFNHSLAKYADNTAVAIFRPFHGTALRKKSVEMGYLNDSVVASGHLMDESLLDMPNFTKDDITGIARVFTLYTHFDQSRWPEIEKAEKNTDIGNMLFDKLTEEYKNFVNYKEVL